MKDQFWWYLARAGGMVAAILLVASLVLGVLFVTRAMKDVDRPAWLVAMHRWFSTLAVVGTAVHVGALVADNYVHFGWKEVLVPGASSWEPLGVALGVISLYLMAAVYGTSLVMRKIPKRWWRWVHLSSYGLVWVAIVHAGLAGTDASNRGYRIVALALTLTAVTAALLRVVMGRPRPALQRPERAPPRTPAGSRTG